MDIATVLLLLLGAGVGVAVDRGVEFARTLSKKQMASRARRARNTDFDVHALIDVLPTTKVSDHLRLATIRISGTENHMPIATADELRRCWPLSLMGPSPIELDSDWLSYPADVDVVERHAADTGCRVFDGTILCLESFHSSLDTENPIVVRPASFYSYATNKILRSRSLSRLSQTRRNNQKITEFFDVESYIRTGAGPCVVGCETVLGEIRDGKPYVLLKHRSDRVLTAPNTYAFVPGFGLEPNTAGDDISKLGLLQHNILRELSEELLGVKELEEPAEARRPTPDWFLDKPRVKEVRKSWGSGEIKAHLLGAGYSCPYGPGFVVVVLLVHGDPFGWSKLMMRGNWEAARHDWNEPSLNFVPLDDGPIESLIEAGEVAPPSSFAFELLRSSDVRHLFDPASGD